MLVWLIARVLVTYQNQGQSLGRWALDMKVVETRYGRGPGLLELAKREGIAGLGALLVVLGLTNLSPTNAGVMLLVLPLVIDCLPAWVDPLQRQALHDRVAGTLVVASRRGYSLDLKLKKMVAEVSRRMKQ
ncbi:RDD family protein [Neosynechococcus sphagnicola]|uniref:RDD family protein n=1 Tax=Neosynechococcus sphagnicola TaxID=1501145 RepID=UPI000B305D49|nr:RDD family protein [Neosynechococcus sphagnicola]